MTKKQIIMKNAWKIRKDVAKELDIKVSNVSMSECLKISYETYKNSELYILDDNQLSFDIHNADETFYIFFDSLKQNDLVKSSNELYTVYVIEDRKYIQNSREQLLEVKNDDGYIQINAIQFGFFCD